MAIKKELNIKSIKPTFTRIVTTADVMTEADLVSESGIFTGTSDSLITKYVQKVVAVGDSSRGVKVGDLVYLDFSRYEVFRTSRVPKAADEKDEFYKDDLKLNIPTVEINGVKHLLLDSSDVVFIIDDYDYTETEIDDAILKARPVEELHNKYKDKPLLFTAGSDLDIDKFVKNK